METGTVIALVFSGLMFTLSMVTFIINNVRSTKKETRAESDKLNEINQSLLKVNLKLDQVCNTTNDIRTETRTMQNRQMEHTEQITVLEQKVKILFDKYDEMKDNLKGIELKGGERRQEENEHEDEFIFNRVREGSDRQTLLVWNLRADCIRKVARGEEETIPPILHSQRL